MRRCKSNADKVQLIEGLLKSLVYTALLFDIYFYTISIITRLRYVIFCIEHLNLGTLRQRDNFCVHCSTRSSLLLSTLSQQIHLLLCSNKGNYRSKGKVHRTVTLQREVLSSLCFAHFSQGRTEEKIIDVKIKPRGNIVVRTNIRIDDPS